MDVADRLRVLFGPYAHPPFRYGDEAACEVCGDVNIVGLSEATLPWPVGMRGRRKASSSAPASPTPFAGNLPKRSRTGGV